MIGPVDPLAQAKSARPIFLTGAGEPGAEPPCVWQYRKSPVAA